MKLATLILLCVTAVLNAQTPELDLELFATGLSAPVDIQNAGDDRLFIVEKTGSIQIFDLAGNQNASPFLSIAVNSNGGEQGLLGLAFHPNYASNGHFFVNYIKNDNSSQISRFTVSSDPDLADGGSELDILNIPQPFSNHNGGSMLFGPEGYLYIALGDGGSGGDPEENGQDLSTLLGALLRIDVDTQSNGNNYGIPTDNPFVENTTARPEIYGYGLRNPWKISYDTSAQNLYIADVGQGQFEEINRVAIADGGGQNFGWRCFEANSPFNTTNCPEISTLTFPVASYSHEDDGLFKCSITGGYVYRGTQFPNLVGKYIFADFCSNEIGYLTEEDDIIYSNPFTGGISSFGQDQTGELYVAAVNSGSLYKLIDATALSVTTPALESFTIYPNPAKEEVRLRLAAFAKADTLHIYNLLGQVVQTVLINDDTVTFSIAQLKTGLYIAKVQGASTSLKLLVQ